MEYSIKIDITKPIIDIEYDNNAADSGTFFRESRRANVTVKERNFDPAAVQVSIKNTDGTIPHHFQVEQDRRQRQHG